MLVKSPHEKDHLSDLQETFDTLRSYNMKLNPGKCVFGVTAGKFLGFMVSQRGIEVNPEKIRAIMKLESPRTVKDVQSLNGKIAALNSFVSKATDRCLPFFRVLRKSFEWTDECQKAFEDLKKYLALPPLLSLSKPGEDLYLYLAASQVAVSAALVREEEGTQRPVYFISKGFRGAEERYPHMEKLAFALP
nr:retrovirus-related pol polyprotein from transposon 412 [Quercus suber]